MLKNMNINKIFYLNEIYFIEKLFTASDPTIYLKFLSIGGAK